MSANPDWQEKAEHYEAEWIRSQKHVRLLQGQLRKMTEGELVEPQVEEIGTFYRSVFGKTDRWAYDETRRKAVKACLREHDLETIKDAIKGYHRFPFVVNSGRAKAGKRSERFDDIELICRNATKIDNGLKLLARSEEEDAAVLQAEVRVKDQGKASLIKKFGADYENPNEPRMHSGTLDTLMRALSAKGFDVVGRGGSVMAQCPVHEDTSPSLHLTEKSDGRVLIYCHGCQAKFNDVLAALDLHSYDFSGSIAYDPKHWEQLRAG